jgi:hypothetical protein
MKAPVVSLACVVGLSLVAVCSAKPPAGKGGGGGGGGTATVDHKGIQAAPIKLGTSGGWQYDLANGYCCGGTLGSLVTDGVEQYILSNFHVLAADTSPGGNGIISQIGDPVIQPGLIDVGCNAAKAQVVGLLAGYGDPLQGANIDAALALVVPGMVSDTGEILGIGVLSANTVAASLNQRVKKSGRTSGLTSSRVDGLNATIRVAYEDECAGAARGTATFTGQIILSNRGSKFLTGGDSGSLLVEDLETNPRAVGLLFAGSSSIAVANPIGDVLDALGVVMVGNTSAAAAAGSSVGSDTISGAARALNAQSKHAAELEQLPGSVGHAVGVSNGGAVVQVLVETATPAIRSAAPRSLDGVPVLIREIGHVVAF